MSYAYPKFLLIVSALVTSFLLPSRVFSQPFDFVGPLFSYSYELLFSQPLCFDIHPHCPGVSPSNPFKTSPRSVPPCLCGKSNLALKSFPCHTSEESACKSFCQPLSGLHAFCTKTLKTRICNSFVCHLA